MFHTGQLKNIRMFFQLHISSNIKPTKINGWKRDPPVCFEYRITSEGCRVAEICAKLFGYQIIETNFVESNSSHDKRKCIIFDISLRSESIFLKIYRLLEVVFETD